MDVPRRQRLERLYHTALTRPAQDRAAFLNAACGDDESLRHDVELLLDAIGAAPGVLTAAANELAGQLWRDPSTPELIGRQLGVYLVQARLGAGGMAQVYRARDTKLGRDVALKILPQAFADDPDRRARFEREARVLAALNHPNIAAIYGFEEPAARAALVLELVDGRTLAERLAKGRCPSMTRSRSRGRSPTRSTPHTRRASSTATSSQPTS